jgi:hypothetical protein
MSNEYMQSVYLIITVGCTKLFFYFKLMDTFMLLFKLK